ncbi:energy-coupling factor transporter ATPase [Paenibacillus filicis]|uniref:Energy-coupling factor transporter ATPase n=1 Tax=Paenibacillus gyeongsangnamensis TaxID=3388067 RepID=A0ABT4QBY9_9BACL|nr:energy-coupling factor transporter ATPase [Paenibacillus filicis]MCZ8514399.1 energy-coupling factor transporter ATPase [Paenibacillus filicis]
MNTHNLQIKNLSFKYPNEQTYALHNLQLDIPAGQFVLVAGPSGCGKSTLGLALAGLIPLRMSGIMDGAVYLGEKNLSHMEIDEISQRVGMVFQNPDNQLIQFKVELEAAFGPENLNLPHEEIERRVNEALHYTGSDKYRKALIETLSGGQKQRVAISAALSMRPSVLVLDEPTSDLDPRGTQEVLKVLRRLNEELGMTIVLIEHKIDEVIPWVDRVLLMDQGRIVVDSSPRKAFCNTLLWNELGVSIPEMVQLSYALPKVFAGRVALTAAEAADALQGTRYAAALSTAASVGRPRPQTGSALLQWKNIELTYGNNRVLQDLNFEVREHEWVAVAGANGSGKTSLAALAMGFSSATAGQMICYDRPVKAGDISKQSEKIGYLFQSADHMLFSPTVIKELGFAKSYGRRTRSRGQYSEEQLAELIDLSDRLEHNPYQLSHGQRQRLALASLLTSAPKTLILDEPTTGQDEGHASAFLEFLNALRETQGLTYLMISHDMRAVAKYADRLAVLDNGRIVLNDRPERVFAHVDRLAECQVVPPPIAHLHGLLTGGNTGWVSLNIEQFLKAAGATLSVDPEKEVAFT